MHRKWGVTALACWPLSWHPNEVWAVRKRGSLDGMLNARMGRGNTHTPPPSLRPRSPLQILLLFPVPCACIPSARAPELHPMGRRLVRSACAMRRAFSCDRLSARPLGISARPACDWKHTVNKCPLGMDAASR